MATSNYFSPKVKQEQLLYEDIIVESLKFYGQDVVYVPREEVRYDHVLNNDYSQFTDAYSIEMYIEDIDGFGGENTIMSKFGLEIRDQATFIVSRRRWSMILGLFGFSRPREGDIIYLPMSKSAFEVKFVEHEKPFYQLKNFPTYQLQCELFEYDQEEFNTGIREIDDIENKNAAAVTFLVANGETDFGIGEIVAQATGDADDNDNPITVRGEVVRFQYIEGTNAAYIHINDMTGSDGVYREFFVSNDFPMVGIDSGAIWYVAQAEGIDPDFTQINDPTATNQEMEEAAIGVIDFSEQNPFGEPDVNITPFATKTTMDLDIVTADNVSITMDSGANT